MSSYIEYILREIMCQESFRGDANISGLCAGVRGSYPMYMFGVVNPQREKHHKTLDNDPYNMRGWPHDEIYRKTRADGRRLPSPYSGPYCPSNGERYGVE